MVKHSAVTNEDIKNFWSKNPVCASAVPYPLGTTEFFGFYDKLREANESVEFSYAVHEYKNFSGKKVLDVGCGNGYVLSKYAQEGAEVFGVDMTETGIDLCRNRFKLLKLKGHFYQQNAEELPFEDESFDCVCSMGVLHHMLNPEKAVAEIHRVLKKGGRLIVMVYHRDSARYRIRIKLESIITGKSAEQLVDEGDGIGNPKGDVYSKVELRHLLRQFNDLHLFANQLKGWHILIKGGRFIPRCLLRRFEKRWGWHLFAKGVR